MSARSVPKQEISVRDGRHLRRKPWKHQQNAIDFLREVLHAPVPYGPDWEYPGWSWKKSGLDEGGAAYLAMDMGTGKSLLGVSMACNLAIGSTLIVTPKRVVPVWPQQFELHSARTDLMILALGDDRTIAKKTEEAKLLARLAAARKQRFILVVNYEMSWREPFASWALAERWGLVILDEIHRIKQPGGKQSMYAARLRDSAIYRLGLSGTPLPHSPLDIYAQYRFLDPSIFGTSYARFKAEYAITGGYRDKQVVAFRNLEKLEAQMASIMFRVGKEVLDLPEEMHIRRECHLSPGAARIYSSLEEQLAAQLEEGTVTAANAMVKLLRLQQVTGGFVKTDDGREVEADPVNAKAELLEEHFEDIDPREPIVVFCRFTRDLALVHEIAKRTGRSSLELSGHRDELREWQNGEANVLAVQIQAGGVGVDLTRARYSIYYSLGFSLGDYKQSLSRLHRPGQTRTVFHIHLLAARTVDTHVMKALEKREDLVESVLRGLREGTSDGD